MKVIRKGTAERQKGTTFTGPVTLERVLTAQRDGGMSLSVVHFEDGARTHWHTHPGEQILFVLEGEGRVGTETEQLRVGPGDVIYSPPGERHWHGAAEGASMTHISVTTVGAPTWHEAPED